MRISLDIIAVIEDSKMPTAAHTARQLHRRDFLVGRTPSFDACASITVASRTYVFAKIFGAWVTVRP